jgi:hypothetical protein
MQTPSVSCASHPLPAAISLFDEGLAEAMRHKWIESERAGRDLGEAALNDWVRRYWVPYLRARWVEHVEGQARWRELDHCPFGVVHRLPFESSAIEWVLLLLRQGLENLDIVMSAQHHRRPIEPVEQVLEKLDINAARLPCPFDRSL